MFFFDYGWSVFFRCFFVGCVILKPLDEAIKANDSIRAVIVGSGINQDGKTKGITMPNGEAQETLMKNVYAQAGLDPSDTGYIEAHGTGTKVGDPIEASALHRTFGAGRTARQPLYVGSVKSNIGHLEGASGVVSVIKTAMMLEKGFILPNFDFKKPNKKVSSHVSAFPLTLSWLGSPPYSQSMQFSCRGKPCRLATSNLSSFYLIQRLLTSMFL